MKELSKLKLTGDTAFVKARQRVEQTISLAAAKALLNAGYLLGVNDGEETTLRYSRDIEAVKQALFTTDEDYLLVWDDADQDDPLNAAANDDPRPDYWVRLVYGNDGWDVISDYSVSLELYLGDGSIVQNLSNALSEDYNPELLLP